MDFVIQSLRTGMVTRSAEETQAIAERWAHTLPPNTVLALHGNLGTGKTTFIAGLARAWDIKQPITSPTFALLNVYAGTRTLLHLDAYRLERPEAIESLCLDDLLMSPFCLAIEWPEKMEGFVPEETLHLYFSHEKNGAHTIRLS